MLLNQRRVVACTGLAAVLGAVTLPSHAVLITDATPYLFSWSYDSQTAAGALSGTGSLTVTGFDSELLTVGVTLTNTSSLVKDRLTAFGFGIDPNATSIGFSDAADGGMISATLASIPGLRTVEVCAWGGQNCAGGSNGGIYGGGASDTFSILLGGLWGSWVNIDPIGFKYQTDFGSFEFTTTSRPPTSVPEPSTIALLGIGLASLGFARRRKKA